MSAPQSVVMVVGNPARVAARSEQAHEAGPIMPNVMAPWTPDEVKQLEERHLVLPFAEAQQELLDYGDKARRNVDGRHKALTSTARSMGSRVRAVLGLPSSGALSVERRTIGARWRDRSGGIRAGYGIVCDKTEVWLGGTVREAELALQVGVSS